MDQVTKISLNQTSPNTKEATSATKDKPIMNSLESTKPTSPKYLVAFIAVAVVLGLISGFLLAKKRLYLAGGTGGSTQVIEATGEFKKGQIFGAQDESIFSASEPATGILQPGGIGGEGSHHIEKGANESQWVYVTSTAIDLDKFVGTKVTVWGETVSGNKAGWLMDVGRLRVEELNAAPINELEASPALDE